MDLTAPLIFASLFLFASVTLFLVYKYGIKKKSYDEVLAEHRKQASALLGPRPKPKEKKNNKKAAKKLNREKVSAASESEAVEEVDDVATAEEQENGSKDGSAKATSSKPGKVHVEFKEEPEEVPVEKEVVTKKRAKKVRPILVRKSSEPEIAVPNAESAPVANHFEEIHPKDEFELLRSNSKEDVHHKSETPKEDKKLEKSGKKNKHHKREPEAPPQQMQNVEMVEQPAPVVEKEKPKDERIVEKGSAASQAQEQAGNSGKEKKKKKSDNSSKQQIIAERDQLIHSVRNAELSRTEVQLLIDLLLNKQLEAPAIIDEWSEGKSDPVQKLKKQLADKEKQLADEQDALAGVQAKLKEVRNEQLAERAQLQLKVRAAEESKVEITAAHARLQQKLQELEEYRGKELANFQVLVEDNKRLQMQIGQLEATLINFQETEALIHTLKGENVHLNKQCQLLTQQRQEQDTNYQNCLIQIQTLERNHNFALNAQQEELRQKHEQQLHRVSESHFIEEQKLKEIISQLQAEIQKLQEDTNVQMNGSSPVEERKEHEVKVLNLTNELSSVKSELSSVSQSLLDAERKYKSDLTVSEEMYNQLKKELEEQKNKNNELRKKNWKVMEALNAAESRTNKSTSNNTSADQITNAAQQQAQKEFIQRLFPEIEVLKTVTSGDWQGEYERVIRDHVAKLERKSSTAGSDSSAEVARLRSEVQRYELIINETDGVLHKLQSHIEDEERNWRSKLSQKDAEIQELREQCVSQLQVKVINLEDQLAQERAEKLRLIEERQHAVEGSGVKSIHADSTLTIEKLSEEVDRLRELLKLEQTKSSDAGIYQNGATS